jgi:CrcB protein
MIVDEHLCRASISEAIAILRAGEQAMGLADRPRGLMAPTEEVGAIVMNEPIDRPLGEAVPPARERGSGHGGLESSWRLQPASLRSVSVFVGGAFGALARWAVGTALARHPNGFPLSTFVVNVSGAFGLGLAGALLTERRPPTQYLRTLVGIGFFGAYTTFSTMAVEGVRLIDTGRVGTALGYWFLTLVVGQMAGVYGMWLGRIEFTPSRSAHEHRR